MPKTYCQAINETLYELMSEDDRIVIVGACCTGSPWYVGGTLTGLKEKFLDRIIDGPVSENVITGMAVGMAISGMRPIVVFPRMDFMLYAMDPIINQAAKYHFMFGGRAKVPIVFWSIINNKGSQGCQHSQDLRWIFSGISGLKCFESFGPDSVGIALKEAVQDDSPCMFFDNRDRYDSISSGIWLRHVNKDVPMPASQSLESKWFEKYDS